VERTPEIIKKLEEKANRLRKSAFARKPQPLSPFGSEYVGFQNRILAATLDSVVLFVTIIPLSIWLTNLTIGQIDMSLTPLLEALAPVVDPVERATIIKIFLVDAGRLQYFLVNSLMQLVGMFAYCMWFWKHYGATLGKMLTFQRLVVLSTGEYLTYAQGFWRCVGYVLASMPLFLGVAWIAWDKNRQGWHDKMVGTVVIRKPINRS
jgi:uncharacterized RDD family membrane protein YckC